MKTQIGRKFKQMIRSLVVLMFATLLIQPAFAAHIPITFEELDGSPSISNIRKIKVESGKINALDTNNGILALNLNGTAANTAGQNGMIQYNLDNGFAAEAAFSYNASTNTLSADNISATTITTTGTITGNKLISNSNINGASLNISGQSIFTGNVSVDAGTLFVDASTNRVGIGTNSLVSELTLNGIAALRNDVTAPTSSNASYGRLYVNSNNLYYMPSGSTTGFLLNNGNVIADPAGSDTQVQFNDGGSAMGADVDFTWNKTSNALSIGKLLASNNINGASLYILGSSSLQTVTAGSTTLSSLSVIGNSDLNGDLAVTGNTTFTGNVNVDAGTLFVNASTNKVGIGTTSPESLFTVNGVTAIRANSTTPSMNSDYGRLYVKTNGNLYYLPTGSSTEYLVNNSNNNTSVVSPTEDYTIDGDDNIVLVNGDLADVVNLPAAASYTGRVFTVKKIDDGTGMVTLEPNGSERIDGELQYHLNLQYEAIKMTSDGSNWFII